MKKHCVLQLHSKAGTFLNYISFEATCKGDLKKQVKKYNEENKDKWVPLKSKFNMENNISRGMIR